MISSAPNMSKKRMKKGICVFELQIGRQLAGNSDLCVAQCVVDFMRCLDTYKTECFPAWK